MQTFDAIVIGAGLTGAAIAYELQRQGQQVMLLESSLQQPNATMLGYGGILHWAGKTPLQRQLCQESRQRWAHLIHELRGETEYRELDLLLYLTAADDPYALLKPLQSCHIPPQFVDSATARSLEPLLNPDTIQGAFVIPQGHIHPGKTVRAYIASFLHQGGHLSLGTVRQLLGMPHRINGVATDKAVFHAPQVIMAAGARGQQLLQPFFEQLPLYFTHAYLLKTPPIASRLKTLLMPANIDRRINLEATAPQYDWHQTTLAAPPSVLEAGAVHNF